MSTAPVPPDGGNPTDNDEAARQILDLLAEVGWVLHGWNDAGSLPRQVARRCAAFAAGRAAATPDPPDDREGLIAAEFFAAGLRAASPDERLREATDALATIYVILTGAEPMWAEMPLDERCARAANEAQQAFLAADREAPNEPKETTT